METRKSWEFEQCLICLSTISRPSFLGSQDVIRNQNLESNTINKEDENIVSKSFLPAQGDLLSPQLYVDFVFKKVLELSSQLSSQQLQSYVEKRGNPENWIKSVCDKCNVEIVKVRGMFEKLHRISKEYEDGKEKLKEKLKSSSSDSLALGKVNHKTDLNSPITKITAECREIFLKKVSQKKQAPTQTASVASPTSTIADAIEDFNDDDQHLNSHETPLENEDKIMDVEISNVELLARLQSEDIYCDSPGMSGPNSPLEAESDSDMAGTMTENGNMEVDKQLSDHEIDNSKIDEDSHDYLELDPVSQENDSSYSDVEPKAKRRRGGAKNSKKVEESVRTKTERIETESREDTSGDDEVSVGNESDDDEASKVKGFTCSICPPGSAGSKNSHPTIDFSIRHFLLHKQGHLKCVKCDYAVPLNSHPTTLSYHWKIKHNDAFRETPVPLRYVEVKGVNPVIPWYCPKCKASFPSEEERDEHLESNHQVCKKRTCRKYKCDLCTKTYVLLRDMVVHKLVVHDKLLMDLEKDLRRCSNYSRRKAYEEKYRNRKKIKKPKKRDQETNKVSIDVNEPARFQCSACRKAQSRCEKRTLDEFLDHYLDHMTKTYMCTFCRRLFPLPDVHHGPGSHAKKLMALPKDQRFPKHAPRIPFVLWWCPVCHAHFRCDEERDNHMKYEHRTSEIEKLEKCRYCPRTYLNPDELKLHENTKHIMELRGKPCDICGEVFLKESLLLDHQIIEHNASKKLSQRKFMCDVSGCKYKISWTISDFLDHYVEHKKNKFKCSVVNCQVRTSNPRYFSWHHWWACHQDLMPQTSVTSRYEVDENPPAPKVSWWCSLCDAEFASDDERDAHLKEAHKSEMAKLNEKTLFCIWCPKSFNCPDELSVHTTTSHTEETRFIKCDECDEEFTKEKLLTTHKKSAHDTSLFVCSFCGTELNCSDDYAATGVFMHVWKEHTRKNEKIMPRITRFQCDICKKKFRTQHYLYVHNTMVHNKSTFRMCQICGKGFTVGHSLKLHMAANHNCSECDEVLADQELLRQHKLEKHGIVLRTGPKRTVARKTLKTVDNSGGTHVCHVCGSAFLSNRALSTHVRFKHKDAGRSSKN